MDWSTVYNATDKSTFISDGTWEQIGYIDPYSVCDIPCKYVQIGRLKKIGGLTKFVMLVRRYTKDSYKIEVVFKPLTPEKLSEYIKTYSEDAKRIYWAYYSPKNVYYTYKFLKLWEKDQFLLDKCCRPIRLDLSTPINIAQ